MNVCALLSCCGCYSLCINFPQNLAHLVLTVSGSSIRKEEGENMAGEEWSVGEMLFSCQDGTELLAFTGARAVISKRPPPALVCLLVESKQRSPALRGLQQKICAAPVNTERNNTRVCEKSPRAQVAKQGSSAGETRMCWEEDV